MKEKQVDAFEYQCFQGCFYKILTTQVRSDAKYSLDFLSQYSVKFDKSNRKIPLRIHNNRFLQFSTLGVENAITKKVSEDIEELFQEIDELLSRRIPVVLSVNIRSFSYHPFYNKADFLHGIIIKEKKSSLYYVVDDYAFWNFSGWMTKEKLTQALDLLELRKVYSIQFQRYCMYWIDTSKLYMKPSQAVEAFTNKWFKYIEQEKMEDSGRIKYLQLLLEVFRNRVSDELDYQRIEADIFDVIHDYRLIKAYLDWIINDQITFSKQLKMQFDELFHMYIMLRKRILKVSYQKQKNTASIQENIIELVNQENKLFISLKSLQVL